MLFIFAVSIHIQKMLQAPTNLWHQDRKVDANIKQALLKRIKPLFWHGKDKIRLEIGRTNLARNLERTNLARNLERKLSQKSEEIGRKSDTASSSHPLPSLLLYTRSPSYLCSINWGINWIKSHQNWACSLWSWILGKTSIEKDSLLSGIASIMGEGGSIHARILTK